MLTIPAPAPTPTFAIFRIYASFRKYFILSLRPILFHVTKQMCTEIQVVIGQKCIRGDDGNLSLDNASKKLAYPLE